MTWKAFFIVLFAMIFAFVALGSVYGRHAGQQAQASGQTVPLSTQVVRLRKRVAALEAREKKLERRINGLQQFICTVVVPSCGGLPTGGDR